MDVIRLLNCKNRCLERFLTASDEFLTTINSGDFAGLESFYTKRDRILRGFDLYDRKLSECIRQLTTTAPPSPEITQQVAQALAKKDLLVKKIAEVDAQIIETIEMEKSRIQREMMASQKSATFVRKFKSAWVPESGDELDKTL